MAKNTYKQDEVLEEPFDIKHLLRASSYIKKYAKRMVFAILLSGIGGASGYVAPMIIQRALDLAIPEKNERLLFSLVGMLVGIYLVSVIFTTIRSRIMVDVSQSIIYDIRKDLFAHLQELPFQYYDDRPHGKILIRGCQLRQLGIGYAVKWSDQHRSGELQPSVYRDFHVSG